MKKMIRPKQAIAAALAAVLVLGGLGNALWGVLCLGADGHIGIEFSQETRCSGFPSAEGGATGRVGQELNAQSSDSSHCGPCVDIPIGIGDPARQPNRILQGSKSSVKAPVAVASGFSFSPLDCATRQHAPKAQCVGNDTLVSLWAVVLLI